MLGGNDKMKKCIYFSGILHMWNILLSRTLKILRFVFTVGNKKSFAKDGILRRWKAEIVSLGLK